MKIISFKEHGIATDEIDEGLLAKIETSEFINKTSNGLSANYYIGVSWLIENELGAIVEPKIDNIDFMPLFSSALSITTEKEAKYFSQYYGINFDQDKIAIENSSVVDCLTPLMIAHYISLLKLLLKRGLKRGYVWQEENLHSKIKGKILFQKNFRHNQLTKREDRIYCGFSEYTVDIPENRLLKKALLFTEKALNNCLSLNQESQKAFYDKMKSIINSIKPSFEAVSNEIQINEVNKVKTNKLFKTYREAISVAKSLLRKYDYSFKQITTKSIKTYPFWIDMPRLYEMYVYSKLKEKFPNELEFQVEGYGRGEFKTAVDFILKKQGIILDAKYKPRYENSKSGVIDDIRELSGYARDVKILDNFDISHKDKEIPCVIIYPSGTPIEDFVNDLNQSDIENKSNEDYMNFIDEKNRFKPFRNFYFYKLSLPAMC